MKIRFGLVLMLALGLGTAGCASGGAASGDSASGARPSVPGGEALAQGERPRQTENTRAAQRHIDAGDAAEDPAEARMHYEQALEAAMAAIAEDGRNPLAHRQAALINLALEDYTAAGAHFDHASGLRPIYEFEDIGIRERAWIEDSVLVSCTPSHTSSAVLLSARSQKVRPPRCPRHSSRVRRVSVPACHAPSGVPSSAAPP